MDASIKNLLTALKNKSNTINAVLIKEQHESYVCDKMRFVFGNRKVPEAIVNYYSAIKELNITGPRQAKIFSVEELTRDLAHPEYIVFAELNNICICFDISQINIAGEWNIVNGANGFVITKTLASFYTNKIWAWVDRGRAIWNDEHL